MLFYPVYRINHKSQNHGPYFKILYQKSRMNSTAFLTQPSKSVGIGK